ncbi:hypothetical protein AV530_009789 [Patagioenas fasciata monilis]|uniref:Uncharacterized protein n=1 Tax=Patagioenas fasciata monilis TaxID=372326 RepID=A0A1V4KAA6_PATFA|nr:hypothetical protein AV530_009789 [Patagioenas fasciata monilis]
MICKLAKWIFSKQVIGKKERCCMVRVAAINRTGGSVGTSRNSWLFGQDRSHKLVETAAKIIWKAFHASNKLDRQVEMSVFKNLRHRFELP